MNQKLMMFMNHVDLVHSITHSLIKRTSMKSISQTSGVLLQMDPTQRMLELEKMEEMMNMMMEEEELWEEEDQ